MSFPKYEKYKDSGVEWLGDIPAHWVVAKTSRYFKIAMGQTILKEDLIDDGEWPVFSATEGDHYFGRINVPQVRLRVGDLVIPARGNSIGSVKLVKEPATTTQTTIYCKHLSSDTLLPCFVFQFLRGCRDNLFYFTQTAIPQITVEEVGSNPIVIPPSNEQEAIITFLDRETAKIDELVAEQHRLIELLKEKRQAVISHAVTRGLNPNVKLKPSGIEWLGDVPAHWEIKRLKLACHVFPSNVDKKSHDGEEPVLLCNYTDVYYNDKITSGMEFMAATASSNQIVKFTLRAGDTIITKDSETADDIAIGAYVQVDLPGVICGYHLSILRPMYGTNGAFIKRLFDSTYIKSCVAVRANGLTRVGLGQYAIDNLEIPFPALVEQTAIADFLDSELAKLDILTVEAQRAIDLFQERRTALISAAVTGKIDVRQLNKN